MLLPRDQALRFIEGYKSALLTALKLLGVDRTSSVIADLANARAKISADPALVEKAFAELSAQGNQIDADVVQAIRSMKISEWVYLRNLSAAAIFIDKEVRHAYAVKALTTPIQDVVDGPPAMFTAGVFQFAGLYVCDGIVVNAVMLGPGYKAQFNAAYSEIRKAGRFHAKAAV
jgi:hypothetical protein